MNWHLFNALAAIDKSLATLTEKVDRIMSVLTDLQAADAALQAGATALNTAVTALQADIAEVITLVQGLQSGTVNADDPQVAAVTADLQATAAQLATATTAMNTAATSLTGVLPPPTSDPVTASIAKISAAQVAAAPKS